MLLARAFVLGLSPRAVLAILALALSIAYALVSAGALSGLDSDAATLDEARDQPGVVLHAGLQTENGIEAASFPVAEAPQSALRVDWTEYEGIRIATYRPVSEPEDFPGLPPVAGPLIGPYAPPGAQGLGDDFADEFGLEDAKKTRFDYLPQDALVVSYPVYNTLFPERADQLRLAYVPGQAPDSTELETAHWQGIAVFYEEGAAQLHGGLIGVIITTGAVAALLASGLVYLEVLARRRDLATLEALGGHRLARRLVVLRTLALVVAGVIAGLALSLAALRLAGVAMGTSLHVPALAWFATIFAVGAGAMLTGSLAGLRALRRYGLKDAGTTSIPVRRFPGPIRFFTVTPRIFPGVFAATLVTASILLVIVGATAIPATLFQAPDDEDMDYVGAGSGNILRGSVDRMLGTHGQLFTGIESTSPETFAPTALNGRPIMVRGVDHTLWRDHEDGRLVDGKWPQEPGEASIGVRATRATGLGLGDAVMLPASYHRGAEPVLITAVHRSGGLEDDQILTDLDTAGRLAGFAGDRVTGVRVKLSEPDAALPSPTGVYATRLVVTPTDPVPFTKASAKIDFLNFEKEEVTHTYRLRVNDETAETATVHVPARGEATARISFTVPDAPQLRVEVNPSQELNTRPLTLQIDHPEVARPGEEFTLSVQDLDNATVADATILVGEEEAATTESNGQATLVVDEPSLVDVIALRDDEAGFARVRVAPEEWDDEAHLVAETLEFGAPQPFNETHKTVQVEADLVNLGGEDFENFLEWTFDDSFHLDEFTLESGTRGTNTLEKNLAIGTHEVTVGGLTRALVIRDTDANEGDDGGPDEGEGGGPSGGTEQNPPSSVEEYVAQRVQRSGSGADRPGDPLDTFIARIIEDLDGATFLIVMATLIHGGSLVWVSTLRDVRERERIPGMLRTLGANEDQLRTRTLRDVFLAALAPIVLALLLAPLVLGLLAQAGYPAAFGHTLPAPMDFGFLARIGAALMAIAVVAALYGVYTNRPPRTATAPRRELPEWFTEARHDPAAPTATGRIARGPTPGGPR